MSDWVGKRYWLVGASEGLGRSLAECMSRAGIELVLTARDEKRLEQLSASLPGKSRALACDITDSAAVTAAAETLGEIDGVVIVAGVYWPVDAKDWKPEEVVTMCDTNVTGTARVLGAVVPGMVARDRGHVVLTGSFVAYRGLPGTIGYGASKAAILSLAESMHVDLRPTGVTVQVVNPGFIRTRMTAKNDFNMPFMVEADAAAREVFDFMGTGQFKRNFPTLFSWVFRLGQFLPDWAYYAIWGAKAPKSGH